MNHSKRQFIKSTLATAAGVTAHGFGLNMMALANASAAGLTSGYKALVCIYLDGGNDSFNTVVPITPQGQWAGYSARRTVKDANTPVNSSLVNLALWNQDQPGSAGVPLIDPARKLTGAKYTNYLGPEFPVEFALHPSLTNVEALYRDRKAAIVANVGPLIKLTTMDNYATRSAAGDLPRNLFSHSDQIEAWQRDGTTTSGVLGWGGSLGYLSAPPAGLDGRSVFIGTQPWFSNTRQGMSSLNLARGTTNGGVQFGAPDGTDNLFGLSGLRSKLMELHADGLTTNKIENTYAALVRRSSTVAGQVESLLGSPSVSVPPPPAGNQLADDLRLIAKMIKANAGSAGRQVFFVSLGSFDTHSDQLGRHAALLTQLDGALAYFQNALGTTLHDKVTTFTASDFGRKLVQNDNGTDHGWGGHQFVVGGAVNGGKVFGSLPDLENLEAGQLMSDGTMIPTISLNDYIWPMAEWFGADKPTVDLIFGTGSGLLYKMAQSSSKPLMLPPPV